VTWFGLAVCTFAAYRATRVVTTDSITEHARDRLYHWAWIDPDDNSVVYQFRRGALAADGYDTQDGTVPLPRAGAWRTYVNELFNCPWCLGVWVSFAVVAFWSWVVRDGIGVGLYLVCAAAVAGGQGFLASRKDA